VLNSELCVDDEEPPRSEVLTAVRMTMSFSVVTTQDNIVKKRGVP
jgi:hypothetical protein